MVKAERDVVKEGFSQAALLCLGCAVAFVKFFLVFFPLEVRITLFMP